MPHTCIICGHLSGRSQDMCWQCLNNLPILTQTCSQCANLLPTGYTGKRCGQCVKNAPPFDRTFALWDYQPPIPLLITQLKFHQDLVCARILGEFLLAAIRKEWYRDQRLPDLLIPMPLHTKRLQERGYNQALEIARPIIKALKIPISNTICLRIKATEAQTTIPTASRKQNVSQAFKVQGNVSGLHIAVLDDVITTGHTITTLTETLKQAGAATIDVWCCAKTQIC